MMITKGLPDYYTAVQMHLHWGGWDLEASGAEHTLDGIRYMAEVRLFVKERETTYVVYYGIIFMMFQSSVCFLLPLSFGCTLK